MITQGVWKYHVDACGYVDQWCAISTKDGTPVVSADYDGLIISVEDVRLMASAKQLYVELASIVGNRNPDPRSCILNVSQLESAWDVIEQIEGGK